jgi:hypothetical protein
LIEFTVEAKRYVVAGGKYRQERDLARRNTRLEKAEKELKRLAAVRRKSPMLKNWLAKLDAHFNGLKRTNTSNTGSTKTESCSSREMSR